MNKQFLRNNQGFTLVELMVVVAIIGILSSVAIPNFKKFSAKARTSEAKLKLAGLYTSEIAFQADYSNYGTCLAAMGYEPSPGTYAVGFADNDFAGSDINTIGDDNSVECPKNATTIFRYPASSGVGISKTQADWESAATYTSLLGAAADSGAAADTFTARAGGFISADKVREAASEGAASDIWQIDQDKTLSVIQRGF